MERAQLEGVLRATGRAVERRGAFFLADPGWPEGLRTQAERVMAEGEGAEPADEGWLGVPTGGTSGTVRFARHDERTLGAAVRGFRAHFDLGRVNAVDILPAHHVSGLMARVRCAVSGGEHLPWSWKRL